MLGAPLALLLIALPAGIVNGHAARRRPCHCLSSLHCKGLDRAVCLVLFQNH